MPIRDRREECYKKNRQIRTDIYLHYLERSSKYSSGCELRSREHNDRLRAAAKGQNTFFLVLGGLQGRMHIICCLRRRKYISQSISLISVPETSLVVI